MLLFLAWCHVGTNQSQHALRGLLAASGQARPLSSDRDHGRGRGLGGNDARLFTSVILSVTSSVVVQTP